MAETPIFNPETLKNNPNEDTIQQALALLSSLKSELGLTDEEISADDRRKLMELDSPTLEKLYQELRELIDIKNHLPLLKEAIELINQFYRANKIINHPGSNNMKIQVDPFSLFDIEMELDFDTFRKELVKNTQQFLMKLQHAYQNERLIPKKISHRHLQAIEIAKTLNGLVEDLEKEENWKKIINDKKTIHEFEQNDNTYVRLKNILDKIKEISQGMTKDVVVQGLSKETVTKAIDYIVLKTKEMALSSNNINQTLAQARQLIDVSRKIEPNDLHFKELTLSEQIDAIIQYQLNFRFVLIAAVRLQQEINDSKIDIERQNEFIKKLKARAYDVLDDVMTQDNNLKLAQTFFNILKENAPALAKELTDLPFK